MFKADLHCHSTHSDGTFTPEELLDHAQKLGLNGLSITDHDTINAYATALPYAKKLNFKLLPGVEFSTSHKAVSVHILAYGYRLDAPEIAALCLKHKERRSDRNRAILEKLAKAGMPVTLEEANAHTLGRPHIAQEMVKKGYVASVEEAFKKYLAENKPYYVPGRPISISETLEVIHQAKGAAVIAHPHLFQKNKFVTELLQFPFDGIECFYSRYHRDQCVRWLEVAKQKGWLMTGGSDFHGSTKPDIELGCSFVEEETFNTLYALHQRNNI